MAGKEQKITTVIIKVVDLECSRCSKMIKSTLCTLQKRFKITSTTFDEKKNTVTVSGPFNPDCFIKKLCCMARKVIEDVEIKKPDPPPPPPPPPSTKPEPRPLEVVLKFQGQMQPCCYQPCPCYEPHHGCCRCCSCGHVSAAPPQPMYPCYKIVCEDEPSYGCSIM